MLEILSLSVPTFNSLSYIPKSVIFRSYGNFMPNCLRIIKVFFRAGVPFFIPINSPCPSLLPKLQEECLFIYNLHFHCIFRGSSKLHTNTFPVLTLVPPTTAQPCTNGEEGLPKNPLSQARHCSLPLLIPLLTHLFLLQILLATIGPPWPQSSV